MLLSSRILILCRITFLTSVAYYLLSDPEKVYENGLLLIAGHSMGFSHIVKGEGSDQQYEAFTGAMVYSLLVMAISDSLLLSRGDVLYFEAAIPFRLMLAFAVSGFGYLRIIPGFANSFVFVMAFLDVVSGFWTMLCLRDERTARNKTKAL